MTDDAYLVGYARISTGEQSLDLQVEALRKAGVLEDNIHTEIVSGAARKRPRLELCFMDLREGDTLVVWRLDRLARSLKDLIERVQQLEEMGCGLRSLTESIDTTTAGGRLILHVMGAIAEFERQLIVERTKAGMKAAIARGAKPGQPPSLTADEVEVAQQMRISGVPIQKIAEHFECSKTTIYNWTIDPAMLAEKKKR